MLMRKAFLLVLILTLSACATQPEFELSTRKNPNEGLNLFTVSDEDGIIEGAYLEGEYRVDFEARRGSIRPLFSIILEPKYGLYDRSACFIAKNGDPFIIQDYCSVPPLCDPYDVECEEPDSNTRTKEFELAAKASDKIANISFPRGLKWQKEALVNCCKFPEIDTLDIDTVSE